jgi:hypothetical protein
MGWQLREETLGLGAGQRWIRQEGLVMNQLLEESQIFVPE